ncbi:MAG: hypothetical protein Ct9H300mP11_15160 [Chloroflexota bacterium]|nr:MAG: hypothetical protein Ct9H300mP11_15160 [Chloroflexota bacterium]
MMDMSGNWFIEAVSPELSVMLKVRKVYYSGRTAFQKVEVLDSELFGRSLILDGKTKSTERDEHIYHETLVHPAMLSNPDPKQVFIGGGGEGGTLREVLRHNSVERATMIDLDSEVVAYAVNTSQIIIKAVLMTLGLTCFTRMPVVTYETLRITTTS